MSTSRGFNAVLRGTNGFLTVRQVALEYNTVLGLNGNVKCAKVQKVAACTLQYTGDHTAKCWPKF